MLKWQQDNRNKGLIVDRAVTDAHQKNKGIHARGVAVRGRTFLTTLGSSPSRKLYEISASQICLGNVMGPFQEDSLLALLLHNLQLLAYMYFCGHQPRVDGAHFRFVHPLPLRPDTMAIIILCI